MLAYLATTRHASAKLTWWMTNGSVDLGGKQIADDTLRLVLAFSGSCHDLVEGSLHAVELELTHEIEKLGFVPSDGPPEVVVAGTIGDRRMAERQYSRRYDVGRRGELRVLMAKAAGTDCRRAASILSAHGDRDASVPF